MLATPHVLLFLIIFSLAFIYFLVPYVPKIVSRNNHRDMF